MTNQYTAPNPNRRLKAKERRIEILEMMKEVGKWNLPVKKLAEKYGVSRIQIYDDIKKILKQVQPEDLSQLALVMDMSFQKAQKELMRLANDTDKSIKMQALRTLLEWNEKYTRFLENWSYKAKVADKVEVQGQISTIDTVKQWLKPEPTMSLTKLSSLPVSTISPTMPNEHSTIVPPASEPLRVEDAGEKR